MGGMREACSGKVIIICNLAWGIGIRYNPYSPLLNSASIKELFWQEMRYIQVLRITHLLNGSIHRAYLGFRSRNL